MSLRIIFAGTPDFAVPSLEALLNSEHEVIAVYTQPDRPAGRGRVTTPSIVKQLAGKFGKTVFQPASLRSHSEYDRMVKLKPDVFVVVAYGLIIPREILTIPRFGCINVHASLLPRWRGASPIQHSILSGDKKTGVTIMQMEEGLDTGAILAQWECEILPEDTTGTLHDRLAESGAQLLVQTINNLEAVQAKAVKQEDAKATYAPKIQKKDAKIDWKLPSVELARRIRAFNPFPIAYTHFHNEPLRIWQAESLDENHTQKPGHLIRVNKDSIDVASGRGVLRLLQVQLPGKRVQAASDFINAHREELMINHPLSSAPKSLRKKPC